MAQLPTSLAAARRAKRRLAICALEGKLAALYARVIQLEDDLTQERSTLLGAPGPSLDSEVSARFRLVEPIIRGDLAAASGGNADYGPRDKVLRNVACHVVGHEIGIMSKLSLKDLNSMQRGSRRARSVPVDACSVPQDTFT